MKVLPLAYAKDMQEDKEHVFDAFDTLRLMAAACAGMAHDMKPNTGAMKQALTQGFITATDLADWLVREANVPFRDAHHITGKLVKLAEGKKIGLEDLSLAEMKKVDRRITQAVYSVLRPERAVASRTSFGGTAPPRVTAAAQAARVRYLKSSH